MQTVRGKTVVSAPQHCIARPPWKQYTKEAQHFHFTNLLAKYTKSICTFPHIIIQDEWKALIFRSSFSTAICYYFVLYIEVSFILSKSFFSFQVSNLPSVSNSTNYLLQSIKCKRWRVFSSIDAGDNRLLSIHYSAKFSQEGSCLLSCHVAFKQLFYFLRSVHLDSISTCSAPPVLQGRNYWYVKVLGTICQSESSATMCWLKFIHFL